MEVLRSVLGGEAVHADLILSAEIVLDLVEIAGEVVVSGEVSNKDGVIDLHWSALSLEAEIRVQGINDPGVVIGYVLGR